MRRPLNISLPRLVPLARSNNLLPSSACSARRGSEGNASLDSGGDASITNDLATASGTVGDQIAELINSSGAVSGSTSLVYDEGAPGVSSSLELHAGQRFGRERRRRTDSARSIGESRSARSSRRRKSADRRSAPSDPTESSPTLNTGPNDESTQGADPFPSDPYAENPDQGAGSIPDNQLANPDPGEDIGEGSVSSDPYADGYGYSDPSDDYYNGGYSTSDNSGNLINDDGDPDNYFGGADNNSGADDYGYDPGYDNSGEDYGDDALIAPAPIKLPRRRQPLRRPRHRLPQAPAPRPPSHRKSPLVRQTRPSLPTTAMPTARPQAPPNQCSTPPVSQSEPSARQTSSAPASWTTVTSRTTMPPATW